MPREDTITLARFVREHPRLFVLTGAGASTGSGIPGYRDAEGRWTRPPPMRIDEFLRSPHGYRRYWYRSVHGWPRLALAQPNAAHAALAKLEAAGYVARLVTQNVDGLHQRAGSASPIELHGNVHRVKCLACGVVHARTSIQHALERENPHLPRGVAMRAAPDGDADVDVGIAPQDDGLAGFAPPRCTRCDGMLKPDVVFFGESVPRERVDAARGALERADAMLVVGSSLMVYSGYRFCEWAARAGKPIAALNLGRTRADPQLALKIEAPCADVLAELAQTLGTDGDARVD